MSDSLLLDIVRELAHRSPARDDPRHEKCDFCRAMKTDGRSTLDLGLHHDRCLWRRAKELTR